VGTQEVRIQVPEGTRPGRVHLLVSDKAPHFQVRGTVVSVVVPSILDHEVVAIDLREA
jgi:hypothetical protein